MKFDRGKLIYTGIMGKDGDSKQSAKRNFLILLSFTIIFFISIPCTLLGIITIAGSSGLAFIFNLFVFLVLLYFLFFVPGTGLEIDAIYENGISHRYTTLFDRLRNENFHYYEDITNIEYGTTKTIKGKSNYIRFFKYGERNSRMPYFCENMYKNDFYDRLIETLEENCPNAKWKEINEV